MKTSELTGPALNWAVHIAMHGSCEGYAEHDYSTDWAQGGPIIEREKIDVIHKEQWEAWMDNYDPEGVVDASFGSGPTPLIAAMRCFVASKLGDDVEVPQELTQ